MRAMYNGRCRMSSVDLGAKKSKAVGRPRAYELSEVIQAAGELFWEQGYETTSIGDLEEKTGLDRSSLYHAFGNKRALFDGALRSYVENNINARLAGMRQPDAGLDSIVGFFAGMATVCRTDRRADRGCLMVNTIGELGPHDPRAVEVGTAYRESFREAFGVALTQAARKGEVDGARSRWGPALLTAITMGLFVTARIDLADAAEVCDAVAAEVASWRARHGAANRRRHGAKNVKEEP